MTLLLLDGLEDLSSWRALSGTIGAGRYQNGFISTSSGPSAVYDLFTDAQSDTLTVGFAWKINTLATNPALMNLYSDNATLQHNRLRVAPDGSVFVQRGASTIGTATAAGIIAPNTWYYLEWQLKLHDTTGTVTVRVDGSTVINLTNVDTKNAGTKTVYDAVVIDGSTGSTQSYDDVYIKSGAGESFLGNVTVETLYPNGNGDVSQWIGSDGNSTDNYLLVDEVPHSVTDYVSTATVGQQDLYALGGLVHTDGTIVGICHSAHMLRTDTVTPVNVKLLNRRGATNAGPAIPLGTTYRSYDHCLTLDPETGAPFTIADVNALQSGVELA